MRFIAFICLLFWAAVPAGAQSAADEDKGYLQELLEDALSDAGREVRITGFRGALSSNAELDELTIADDEGVWLTLKEVSLIWSRTALLRGRLEVEKLTAAEIIIPRKPQTAGSVSTEDAVAQPFALPELPISINIDSVKIDVVDLGAPVLGEAVRLNFDGKVSLDAGEGAARFNVARIGTEDQIALNTTYANDGRVLMIDMGVNEGSGGLISGLLGMSERPSLELTVTGDAPLSDFTADVALRTDQQLRLGGQVRLYEEMQAQGEIDDPSLVQKFDARLEGDIRPLFSPEMRAFFGEETMLHLAGQNNSETGTQIETLLLRSAMLNLNGDLHLSKEGWPQRFKLNGLIAGGGPVTLPVSGGKTQIESAQLSLEYDHEHGEAWKADITVSEFHSPEATLAKAHLSGRGVIAQNPENAITAVLLFELLGLELADKNLSDAVGQAATGSVDLRWQDGKPIVVDQLNLRSGNVTLSGQGQIDSVAQGVPVLANLQIEAKDLSRFATVVQRELGGSAEIMIDGQFTLLSGEFDLELEGQATDLHTGEARLDPLLTGVTRLLADVKRDADGTTLRNLTLQNPALDAKASAQLNTDRGKLTLSARLSDLSLAEPTLSGPARVDLRGNWVDGGVLSLQQLDIATDAATLSAIGELSPQDPDLPVSGTLDLKVSDLSAFADLTQHPLAGQIDLVLRGNGELKNTRFSGKAELNAEGFETGISELDALTEGVLTFSADGALAGQEAEIVYVRLKTPQLALDMQGSGPGAPVDLNARLANLGLFAPGFGGPLGVDGAFTLQDLNDGNILLSVDATGPNGGSVKVNGEVREFGADNDLQITGRAPLGLVNRFISPRSVQGMAVFNLAMTGPATLDAVSGRVDLGPARVALPGLNTALQDLRGTISLSGRQAVLDINTRVQAGGNLTISGPLALSAPYSANIDVGLERIVLRDPNLYQTRVDGGLSVNGPLTGGALISGRLELSETEIRIPSGTPGIGTAVDIRHIHEPRDVRTTRRRAGLIKTTSGRSASYPLDITVNAPRGVFVRGRGLDSELSGSIRLSGTTNDVIPSGVFELIRGRLDILGKRLDLSEGLIDLRGAFDPYLRFVAETTSNDFLVQIIIEGLASAPEITFASQPELPQEEVVARLLFGRGLDSISPFQAAQLASSIATLTGGGGEGITGRIRNLFGLSDLDVTSSESGETQVRAGAYISENIYSEVTAGQDGTREINLNLDLSPSLTLKGSAGSDGSSGVGIFFERDY